MIYDMILKELKWYRSTF